MELTRVITGTIVTEKTERLKAQRTYTLKVHNDATKVDVKAALKKFFDVDAVSIRVHRTSTKTRQIGAGRVMTKRHPSKRMIVTLSKNSPALDLTKFKVS